jgi:predicted ArsR family transcriptional regulator
MSPRPTWTFITNHGAVLALLAQHGQITAREISLQLEVTTRTVRRIIVDLETAGYIQIEKVGRRNQYRVDDSRPLRRGDQRDVAIGDLLGIFKPSS